MTQESKFKENLSSIQDTFVRLTRESDDKVMDINSQFRQESQKVLEASKSNVQNFVAINEEVSRCHLGYVIFSMFTFIPPDHLIGVLSRNVYSPFYKQLESVIKRQNVISDRMNSMAKYDAELSTKIEDTKQYFAKELEEFRNVVLR